MKKSKLKIVGKLPSFIEIANDLWGENADIDSDGNSKHPSSTDWNELTLILRSDVTQRIDINPDKNQKDQLILESSNSDLHKKVITFLTNYGAVTELQ